MEGRDGREPRKAAWVEFWAGGKTLLEVARHTSVQGKRPREGPLESKTGLLLLSSAAFAPLIASEGTFLSAKGGGKAKEGDARDRRDRGEEAASLS